MLKLSLFVRLEAKPGKEKEVAAFLDRGSNSPIRRRRPRSGSPCASARARSPIFDSFRDEAGRQAHLDGPIAEALMAQAPQLLATPPVIDSWTS